MMKRKYSFRSAAVSVGAFLFLLFVLPLVVVAFVAGLQAWQLRDHKDYLSAVAMVAYFDAQDPPQGIAMSSIARAKPRDCDFDVDSLPDWKKGDGRLWAGWGPQDAYIKLEILLRRYGDLSNGRSAVRARYIADHVSDFERRFLIGCASGTLFAPVCFSRIAALTKSADEADLPPDLRIRSSDLAKWRDKTLCAFAKGASTTKPAQLRQPYKCQHNS